MIFLNSDGKFVRKKSYEADFVFVYEVKNREIQGITLIGYELVKRGYSVAYVSAWHELHRSGKRIKAKVAILFEAYNDSVLRFALSFIERCNNAFNMQWEQILSPRCLEEGSIFVLSGDADKVYHCSWGEKNVEHLVDYCGIPADKVKLVGHVGYDFVRPEFEGYYKSREEICKEYGLDSNKKVVLFIASFPSMIQKEGLTMATEEIKRVGRESREIAVEWMEKYYKFHPDTQFIYRPHPTEQLTKQFMDDHSSAMKFISDYSVQQWISIADDILVWRSTSMGDIYMAKKGCLFVNPIDIPLRYLYYMMYDAKKTTSYEEFEQHMGEDYTFPIADEIMKQYYLVDDVPAYKRITDELEKLYATDEVGLDDTFFKERTEQGSRLWLDIRNSYGFYKAKLLYKLGINKSGHDYEVALYDRNADKKNYVSEKEIMKSMMRLALLLK